MPGACRRQGSMGHSRHYYGTPHCMEVGGRHRP
jgi:hypothetical protein